MTLGIEMFGATLCCKLSAVTPFPISTSDYVAADQIETSVRHDDYGHASPQADALLINHIAPGKRTLVPSA